MSEGQLQSSAEIEGGGEAHTLKYVGFWVREVPEGLVLEGPWYTQDPGLPGTFVYPRPGSPRIAGIPGSQACLGLGHSRLVAASGRSRNFLPFSAKLGSGPLHETRCQQRRRPIPGPLRDHTYALPDSRQTGSGRRRDVRVETGQVSRLATSAPGLRRDRS